MRSNHIFVILCCFCFGALAAFWLYALENKPSKVRFEGKGPALIGGPFSLTSHTGKPTTNEDFKGRYMLVYFGYSFCPDICPTDLQKITRSLDLVKEQQKQIQPLFITIDPERDTADQLKSYIANFHPSFIGLTGTLEQIEKIKKAYKVYGVKVDEEGKPTNNPEDDNYLMDHSPQTFLMGPDGKFIRFFRFSTSAEAIAEVLKKTIKTPKS